MTEIRWVKMKPAEAWEIVRVHYHKHTGEPSFMWFIGYESPVRFDRASYELGPVVNEPR